MPEDYLLHSEDFLFLRCDVGSFVNIAKSKWSARCDEHTSFSRQPLSERIPGGFYL